MLNRKIKTIEQETSLFQYVIDISNIKPTDKITMRQYVILITLKISAFNGPLNGKRCKLGGIFIPKY